ncbi:MAG: OadG family protein [Treponema sp.]|jgi:oxaloacetate decarboxylase gamma subunit|nr:OadG family protein [Treponema sp.]
MTILEMLQQSAILTVLGMAIVFLFLWVIIVCVNVVGKLIRTAGLDKDIQQPKTGTPKAAPGVTPEVTAAISAAVTEYRKE